jgi:hypothetical protein
MPTIKQLNYVWESQYEFFGGSGLPKQTYEGNSDEQGLTTQQITDTPIVPRLKSQGILGKRIGTIKWNRERGDLQIIVGE